MVGVMIQCDPSIKAIIKQVDTEHNHEIIIEDLDDKTLIVKETLMHTLKDRLDQVCKAACDVTPRGLSNATRRYSKTRRRSTAAVRTKSPSESTHEASE